MKLSRSRSLPAIAFLCLLAGSLEIYDPVLRAIEDETNLPVTQWAKVVGFNSGNLNAHAGSINAKGFVGAASVASILAETDPATEASNAITLKQIDFTGVTILGDMELKELISRFIGVPMTYEQMLDIGMTVETYYRQNNYLARVIMPPQDLTEGKLMVEVIESVFSKIEVEEALIALPKTQEFVQALIQSQQPLGEVPNTKSLNRGQALANDVSGVTVQGALSQEQQWGETELLLKMYHGLKYQAEMSVDIGGLRSKGLDRLTASLNLFNSIDIDDLLSMVHVRTRGSDYSRLTFSVPVGFDGWRIGANASVMGYEVVLGEAGVKGAVGRVLAQGLELFYPLIREDNPSSKVTITADQKSFENRSAPRLLMSKFESDVPSAQIAGFMRDATPRGSSSSYSLQFSLGHLDLGSSVNQQSELVWVHTAGMFSLLTLEQRHSLENGINMAVYY